jgi:predicted Zn-dependent peptidase
MEKIDIFKIPEYQVSTSANITNILYKNNIQPLLMMVLAFPVGCYEEKIPGLANITMQMLLTGTKKYSATEISKLSDEKGIRLNSMANWDDSFISTYCLSEHYEVAKELLIESFKNPTFDEAELDRQKKKAIAGIELKMSEPDYLAQIGFISKYFSGTNYGHPRRGTMETINSITIDDCKDFYNTISNSKAYFVVAGDLIEKKVLELSAVLQNNTAISNIITGNFISPILEPSITIIDRKDAPQASLIAGLNAMPRLDIDYPILQLVNTIYGGYFGSRLNKILREEKGYTYGIHSGIDSRRYASVMKISSDTDTKHVSKMLPVLFQEADKLMNVRVDDEELTTAKNYVLGAFLRNTETPFQVAGLIRSIHLNEFTEDYFDNYLTKISEVTAEDLQRVVAKHFTGNNFTISISGDEKQLSGLAI